MGHPKTYPRSYPSQKPKWLHRCGNLFFLSRSVKPKNPSLSKTLSLVSNLMEPHFTPKLSASLNHTTMEIQLNSNSLTLSPLLPHQEPMDLLSNLLITQVKTTDASHSNSSYDLDPLFIQSSKNQTFKLNSFFFKERVKSKFDLSF